MGRSKRSRAWRLPDGVLICSPPSWQTVDCYLLFLDPQITSPAPVQWAGLQAALAILSLTGWLENKHFRKGQSEYFLANICFHTQLNGKSFTKQRATNSCRPESPLISSHAALPVNSYGFGILLGREINRKWKRREEVVSVWRWRSGGCFTAG